MYIVAIVMMQVPCYRMPLHEGRIQTASFILLGLRPSGKWGIIRVYESNEVE